MDKSVYERKLLKQIVSSIEDHGGRQYVVSVILSGSFGRGEPTYVEQPDGSVELKSDVEIGVVFPGYIRKGRVNKLIEDVSKEFSEELNMMPISYRRLCHGHNFNYTLLTPKYKTLFTYDLYYGSRTIWGKDLISQRKFSLEAVDPYEGKRLVANRIGELLYLRQNADVQQNAQWKGKLMLAMGSAWLLGQGKYVSSYCGQYERLKTLQAAEKDLGDGFLAEYEKVFRYLRQNGGVYDIPENLLREYTANINRYFQRIGLCKPRVNSFSRMVKYVVKYVKSGVAFGWIGFENRILQALIDGYCSQAPFQYRAAQVWHKVLY